MGRVLCRAPLAGKAALTRLRRLLGVLSVTPAHLDVRKRVATHPSPAPRVHPTSAERRLQTSDAVQPAAPNVRLVARVQREVRATLRGVLQSPQDLIESRVTTSGPNARTPRLATRDLRGVHAREGIKRQGPRDRTKDPVTTRPSSVLHHADLPLGLRLHDPEASAPRDR
jgi:hypothetical protein